MSLEPAPKDDAAIIKPDVFDPAKKLLGETPEAAMRDLHSAAAEILERTGAEPSWMDAQIAAFAWASLNMETIRLVRQKLREVHEAGRFKHNGDFDKAQFAIVNSRQFDNVDARINRNRGQMREWEKHLRQIAGNAE